MNEHTTIDPTTGTDNSHDARKARAKDLDAFWARIDAKRHLPRNTWDERIDLAPIRHTRP